MRRACQTKGKTTTFFQFKSMCGSSIGGVFSSLCEKKKSHRNTVSLPQWHQKLSKTWNSLCVIWIKSINWKRDWGFCLLQYWLRNSSHMKILSGFYWVCKKNYWHRYRELFYRKQKWDELKKLMCVQCKCVTDYRIDSVHNIKSEMSGLKITNVSQPQHRRSKHDF